MIGREMVGVLKTIYINKQMRRYYGKKYDRQAQAYSGGRTQERHFTGKSGGNKS
jgi:hypothetical protein